MACHELMGESRLQLLQPLKVQVTATAATQVAALNESVCAWAAALGLTPPGFMAPVCSVCAHSIARRARTLVFC